MARRVIFSLAAMAVLLWPSPGIATGAIGAACTDVAGNSDCLFDCQASALLAGGTAKNYCTCKEDANCTAAYGGTGDQGQWKCQSGNEYTHNLSFCASTDNAKNHKFAIVPDESKITALEALLDKDLSAIKVRNDIETFKPTLSVRLPGVSFSDVLKTLDDEGNLSVPFIGEYLAAAYKFALVIGSILAVVMIIRAGFTILISGGGEAKQEGYKHFLGTIVGLFILWASYTILYTINPDLVAFQGLKVRYVQRQEIFVDASSEPDTRGTAGLSAGGPVPYFGQYDSAWGNIKPNGEGGEWKIASQPDRLDCTSIRQRGCGTTSLAMVLKYLGKNVTPLETAKWGLGCTGALQPYKEDKMTKKGWVKSPWGDLKIQLFADESQIRTALDVVVKGEPLIFNCGPCVGYDSNKKIKVYKGHYIVLTGSPDGGETFSVNDPGGNPNGSGIVSITRDQIFNTSLAQWKEGCLNKKKKEDQAACVTQFDGTARNGTILKAANVAIYLHK